MEVGEEFLDNHYTVPYWTCTTTQPTMRNQRVDCDIDRPRILDKLYVNTTMVEELHKACQNMKIIYIVDFKLDHMEMSMLGNNFACACFKSQDGKKLI